MSLAKVSVSRPIAVLMIYLAVMLLGVISLSRLPVELMPNYSFGDISIFVDVRGGMPPEEVEVMVAKPIEEAVGQVSHLRDIISISEEGRVRVALKFEPGINMDYVALEVREKMAAIKDDLPPECERPVIAKFEHSDMPVLIVALAAKEYSPEKLRKFVDDYIKEQILRIEGVANIEVGGGRERKIIVSVDKNALATYNVSMQEVVASLGSGNLNLLVGEQEKLEQRYLLRVIGEFSDLEEIKNLPVTSNAFKSVIRLKDVAQVQDSYLEPRSYARVNALPVVSLYIQKETTANTIKVCDRVLSQIDKIRQSFELDQKNIRFIATYNQAEAIKKAINSVKKALVWGGFLASIVLFLFLRNIRSVCVIFITIPVSVIATFALMYLFPQNITLNIMTLSGLALGIGMLVDNSIVVLENIFRLQQKGIRLAEAIVKGAEEMLLAIIASTLTTIIVFLPIVFVNKEIRLIYSGFALTVAFSLAASLVAAITLVPMVYSRLADKVSALENKPLVPFKRLQARYRRILTKVLRYRLEVVAAVLVIFIISLWVFMSFLPKEFVGSSQQEDFTVFVELPTGAKLDISNKSVRDIEGILSKSKEVKTVSSRIEPWSSKIYVKLLPLAQRKKSTSEVIDYLRPKIKEIEKKYKEAFIYFEQPQAVETNEVLVEIYGHDYEVLSSLAIKMLTSIESIKGLTDLKIRWRKGRPEWQVVIDREKAALFGLTVDDVSQRLHSQMRGLRATLYHTEGKQVEVISRFEEEARNTLGKLKKMPLAFNPGSRVYLEQIAEFKPQIGPGKIWRKNKNRMIQISANRGAYPFGVAVDKMQDVFKTIDFPKDYFYRFGQNYQRMLANQHQLMFAVYLMLILVFLVLASLFESYSRPFIIMTTVPLALIGAVIFLVVFGKAVNIGVLMGLIMLGGIVVNNAIVMVDHIGRLKERGMRLVRAIIQGASDRLRPVLITSATTTLGMLPLAIERSEESALWSPLAITVIGGMISATILTLFIIPSIYILLEDARSLVFEYKNRYSLLRLKPAILKD